MGKENFCAVWDKENFSPMWDRERKLLSSVMGKENFSVWFVSKCFPLDGIIVDIFSSESLILFAQQGWGGGAEGWGRGGGEGQGGSLLLKSSFCYNLLQKSAHKEYISAGYNNKIGKENPSVYTVSYF